MHQQEDEGGGASEVVELLRLEVVCSHKGDPLHGEADGSRTQKRLHVSHLCFRGVDLVHHVTALRNAANVSDDLLLLILVTVRNGRERERGRRRLHDTGALRVVDR